MRVAICIATFRRTKLLQGLLEGISELTFRKVRAPDIQVIVADNDASGTAANVCHSIHMRWPLKYVIEPRRGIAQARNRALSEATDFEFVAFIDDDETPAPAWLDELLWAQAQFHADVVSGPVLPAFTDGVPEWVKAGRFFDGPVHPNGHFLDCCATNNVLVSRTVLDHVPTFDEQFALCGCDDVHFFIRVRRAGFSIVSSSEAIVTERISTDRANLGWLLRRAYRGGNSWALVESSLDKRGSTRLVRLVKAFGRIILGSVRVPVSLFGGKAGVTRALRSICLGAGMLTGFAGWKFQEYKSAGGDSAK
jgi:succinoglycan biosynthesis protein ExoM